jgi:hypothetical protein
MNANLKKKKFSGACLFGLGTAIIVLAVLVVLLGGKAMSPELKAQLAAANAAYQSGKFDEAQAAYLQAQKLSPENATILEQLGSLALWRNQPTEAARYFEAAQQTMPWYENFWPLNTQFNYNQAMAAYRQDHFAQAAQYFHEAAGPVAVGPFKELQALGQHAALFAGTSPYRIEGPGQSRIDFVTTDPLPVIPVAVNGGLPLNFIIDTGGAEVILDRALAQSLGVEPVTSFTGSYAGNKGGETGLGKIDTLQLGEFTVHELPIYIMDLSSLGKFNGHEVKGIIGTRLLMHFLATIDYAHGALILRRVTSENLSTLETQAVAQGAKVIPFWLIEMHYIVAEGTFNNQPPTLFLVDTGLEGKGFTAPESDLQKAGIMVDWSKAKSGAGGGGIVQGVDIVINQLTLGTGANMVSAMQVPGIVIKGGEPVLGNQLGFHVGGLISHLFFRPYALTLDFTNMRLYVQ